MATGDKPDQLKRLKSLLPNWFGDQHPVLDALLAGYAYVQAFVFDLIAFAKKQTRILTATGGWLDLIAADFFGDALPRAEGQGDNSYRVRILINLFRERGTRAAIARVLFDLTGEVPEIFEPARIQDAGAYRVPTTGYGVAGRYGSILLPYQAFVTAYRPPGSGIPLVAGYGIPAGAYRTPSRSEYASIKDVLETIAEAAIFEAVDSVKPVGTIIWVRVKNKVPVAPTPDDLLLIGGVALWFNSLRIRIAGWLP